MSVNFVTHRDAVHNPRSLLFPAQRTLWGYIAALWPIWLGRPRPAHDAWTEMGMKHYWLHIGRTSYGARIVYKRWEYLL